jgi:cytolysin-activating lysine-acyltransferase
MSQEASDRISSEPSTGVAAGDGAALVGATISKLISAGIGDIAVIFSRSPAHKYFWLADIEWAIAPAVFNGQYYVAELANNETGLRAPIAVATWAFVSDEVERRIESDLSHRPRLRPEEWKCGENAWIVDLVGDLRGIAAAVEWLKARPFKERPAKIAVSGPNGAVRVETLQSLCSRQAPTHPGADASRADAESPT